MTAADQPPPCAALHLVAEELALGLLEGPARADAVAHVDACAACRHHVDGLARLIDDLLVAVPEAEPSPGFEGRVLEALAAPAATGPGSTGTPTPVVGVDASDGTVTGATVHNLDAHPRPGAPSRGAARRAHRGRTIGIAAAVIIALVLAGGLGVRARATSDAEFVRAAAMVTPAGSRVGRVDVATNPDTVLIALPAWDDASAEPEPSEYRLRITLRDGQSQELGPFALKPGKDMWSTHLGVDAQRVTSVAVLDEHGGTMCTGTFGA